MSITANTQILASDFVATPSGAGDSGKVVKLDAAGKIPTGFMRFGGDGTDGALSISSGTTTVSCANAAIFIKNYSSISITGTGKLAFSNPNANGSTILLKSQGNVTLTSSTVPLIDLTNMGAPGGAKNSAPGTGATGSSGYGLSEFNSNAGIGIASSSSPVSGAGGAAPTWKIDNTILSILRKKYGNLVQPGAGGGGGTTYLSNSSGGSDVVGSDGVSGGGALVIECGGAWNFTGNISVSGSSSANATGTLNGSNSFCYALPGGPGGPGCAVILYNSLTANSGTISAAFGTAGNYVRVGSSAGTGTGISGGSGNGLGYTLVAQNTEFA